jgi:hypothetical protein
MRCGIALGVSGATHPIAQWPAVQGLKGSLEAGKLADLVVLGRDPLREDPSTLVSIPVERTMVGGQWVFEA